MENTSQLYDFDTLRSRIAPGFDSNTIAALMLDNLVCGVAIYEYREEKIKAMYLNEAYYDVVGFTKEQYAPYLDDVTSLLYPEGERVVFDNVREYLETQREFYVEALGKKGDGTDIWVLIKGLHINFIKSDYPVFLAVVQDITERKNKALENAISAERYYILEEATTAVIYDYDVLSDNMTFYYKLRNGKTETRTLRNYTAYSKRARLVHPDDADKFFEEFERVCSAPIRSTLDYRTTMIDLTDYKWARTTYSSVADDMGRVVRLVGRIEDIDEELRERQRMQYLAEIDGTTGLYNKFTAMTRIQGEMDKIARKKRFFAVVDIDNFKSFNDTYGHAFGDKVLFAVAESLRADFPEAITGRFGGDEYIIYLEADDEKEVTERFRHFISLNKSSFIDGVDFNIRCSAGVAWSDNCDIAYYDYFNSADCALYEAKKEGKNRLCIEKIV